MEVRYTLNRDDIWAFHRFHLYRKKRLLRGVDLLGSAVIFLAWLFLSWSIVRHAMMVTHVLGGTPVFWNVLWRVEQRRVLYWLLLTAYAAYVVWGNKWLALHRAVSHRSLAEPKTMRLSAAGVQVLAPTQQSTLGWNAIREVASDAHRLYLYVSPTNALVVPRRAFATPGEAAAFEAEAQNFQADSFAVAAPATPDVWPPPPSRTATAAPEPAGDDTEQDEAPGTLAVSYVTRRGDVWRSALRLPCRRPASLLNFSLSCLFPAMMLIIFSHLPVVPVLGLGILVWMLMVYNWLRAVVNGRLPDSKSERSCRSILRPDAFVDVTPEGRSVLPWREVGEISLFLGDLHLVRRGGIGGSFIPRTAFPSALESQEFLEAMRRYHRAAQDTAERVVA